MIKVSILGGGNVAHHLAPILSKTKGIALIDIYNRSIKAIESLKRYATITDTLLTLKEVDVLIICVTDNAITQISSKIKSKNTLLVHTSGSTNMDILDTHKHYGVLYPLQTFSKNREVDFKNIPFCIEATNKKDLELLQNLASKLSDKVYIINSVQRKKLHIAAVFVNNFVNHLYHTANEICESNEIPFDILIPLIIETAQKITHISPKDSQTGPARRGDKRIIKNHLKELSPNQQEIYKLLSHSISDIYGKKL